MFIIFTKDYESVKLTYMFVYFRGDSEISADKILLRVDDNDDAK